MQVNVKEFKTKPSFVNCMVTIALRNYMAPSTVEGGKYTIFGASAHGRSILNRFFATVLGKVEGRQALNKAEEFVSASASLTLSFLQPKYDLAAYLAQMSEQQAQSSLAKQIVETIQSLLKLWFSKQQNNSKALPTLELSQLYPTTQFPFKSRIRTIIAISGFTSKGTDKQEEWGQLLEYFEGQGAHCNIYALNWEAKNVSEIVADKGNQLASNLMQGGLSSLFGGHKKNTAAGLLTAGFKAATAVMNHGSEVFLDAKVQAKLTGKLLACALALQHPFETQSISLVGFSLGT